MNISGEREQWQLSVEEISAWFNRARSSSLTGERVMELYFTFHPRTAFLKNLSKGSKLADIGAGDGSLSVFRGWPEPERKDLQLYAYSIDKGRLFDDFAGYEISDWNLSPPDFSGEKFDAVVCAHFIEHIADPASFVEWASRKVNRGGRIYLEWPSPKSLGLPGRLVLEAAGVPLIISRFDDDHTHREIPDRDVMIKSFKTYGFEVESQGLVRLPWLEDEILAHFKNAEDGFPRQAAFWSYTGWSQYLVLQHLG